MCVCVCVCVCVPTNPKPRLKNTSCHLNILKNITLFIYKIAEPIRIKVVHQSVKTG